MTIDPSLWRHAPWEHPDWYDLHDTTWTAGPEREPEHYRECLLALPPLDRHDHLVDVGAGTGKLALLIARAYPRLGRVTLIDPNGDKLARAQERFAELLPAVEVATLVAGLGHASSLPESTATIVIIGSVLMPILEFQGGTLADGLAWLRRSLAELNAMLLPGAWLYDVETLAAPWVRGNPHDPVRRLTLLELTNEFTSAGFTAVECAYRFRDRVVLRAQRAAP
jgi:SAM-dependent methyltransferase